MKKLAIVCLIGVAALISACGPSQKELDEKRIQDSIKEHDSLENLAVEQQRIADSTSKALVEQAHADSVAQGLIKE